MIRYTLKCENDHRFESWFQSADGFDALRDRGHVSCPDCGSTGIEKAMMAPNVRPSDVKTPLGAVPAPGAPPPDLTTPSDDRARVLAELRRKIEENSDYVGLNFAAEARAMHEGEKPLRSIYGEARLAEARKLIEEGVPVAPLPFTPKANVN